MSLPPSLLLNPDGSVSELWQPGVRLLPLPVRLSIKRGRAVGPQVLLLRRYSKSPTYEWIPFEESIHKSNKVNLGTQLTQLTIQYCIVIGLQYFSHKNT